jgi:predicted nuclease of restriction endonuclease-like (RecB) superfamily
MPHERKRSIASHRPPTPLARAAFNEVLRLIDAAKRRAYQAVNTELVGLYWRLGEYISKKIASAEWGDGVIEDLAAAIAQRHPGTRGFTRPNLFRMRQFFEAYRGDQRVSSLLTQLPWTHHLTILSHAKLAEEREFYMRMAITERWSTRELERQCRAQRFHHVVRDPAKVSAALRQSHPGAEDRHGVTPAADPLYSLPRYRAASEPRICIMACTRCSRRAPPLDLACPARLIA